MLEDESKNSPAKLRSCSCVTRDTDRLVRDTSYSIGDLVQFSTHEVEDLTVTEDQHLAVTNNFDSLNGGLGVVNSCSLYLEGSGNGYFLTQHNERINVLLRVE